MKVDGCDIDIGKESVLVEKHCASSVVSHVEPVREELVVDILNCFLQRDDVPFPAICFSMAPSLPRRGPGFQL